MASLAPRAGAGRVRSRRLTRDEFCPVRASPSDAQWLSRERVRCPCYNAGMKNEMLVSLRRLSDAALVAGLENSLTREREETASVVAHLAELDTRDVYLREGYPSLFVYCRDALGMSEGEAYNRIEVARTARRFPVVLDMLADGRLHLTAARLLGPHLTLDNHCEVLGSAHGKTKLEIQEIVARLSPRPDVPASVRRLPAPHPESSPQAAPPVMPAPLREAAEATRTRSRTS